MKFLHIGHTLIEISNTTIDLNECEANITQLVLRSNHNIYNSRSYSVEGTCNDVLQKLTDFINSKSQTILELIAVPILPK
jgi:hypothetical protein